MVKKNNNAPSEAAEQIRFVAWLKENNILFQASANGGYKDKNIARGQRYQGVQKGYPDITIFEPINNKHGLMLELKRRPYRDKDGHLKRSYPSLDQKIGLKKLNEKGYVAKVAHGCDEAIAITKEYLGLKEA